MIQCELKNMKRKRYSVKRLSVGSEDFNCEVCGKPFQKFCNLQKHFELHNAKRNYVKTQSHTPPLSYQHKPFQCHVCGERFLFSRNLTAHGRLHFSKKVKVGRTFVYLCDFLYSTK